MNTSAMRQPRWDLLSWLLVLSLVLAPAAVLGRAVTGSHLTLSFSLALLSAGLAIANLLQGRIRLDAGRGTVAFALLPFLLVAILSLVRSPYGAANIKGWVQVAGIGVTLLMALALGALSWRQPRLYVSLLKAVLGALAVIGGVAVLQFTVNNLLRTNLVDFSFLNFIPGEPLLNEGSMMGSLWRATAVAQEPSHLAVYLGIASGVALLRLGLAGQRFAKALSPILGFPGALVIIGGMAVSLSSIGFVALLATAVAIRFFLPQLRVIRLLFVAGFVVAVVVTVVAQFIASESEFAAKLLSVSIIAQAAQGEALERFDTADVTAIALATNFYVMQQNLQQYPYLGVGIGAHPLAFANSDLSLFEVVPERLRFLNSQDAASLLMRILSEMGIIGLASFLLSVIMMCVVLRREIVRFWRFSVHDPRFVTVAAIGIGLGSTIVGLTVASLMRFSLYYGAPLWVAVVLAAGLPALYPRCVPQSTS